MSLPSSSPSSLPSRPAAEQLERHRWWIAGVASMLVPGLGQVYNGRLARGIGLCLAMLLLPVVLLVWVLARGWLYLWLAVPLLVLLGLHMAIITEAMIMGRRLASIGASTNEPRGAARHGRRFGRVWLYAGFAVAVITSFHVMQWLTFERGFALAGIGIDQPDLGLDAGDRVLINRLAFGPIHGLSWRQPHQGQVVVYQDDGGVSRLGRCVATAGQSVAISKGVLQIDGFPVRTLRPRGFTSGATVPIPTIELQAVAQGMCCILSAPLEPEPGTPIRVGMVAIDDLLGEPMTIVWSIDPASGRLRTGRLGLPIL